MQIFVSDKGMYVNTLACRKIGQPSRKPCFELVGAL